MYLIRLLIIGDTGVGKTSLLLRFNDNHFVKNQKTTIGVDYKAKEIQIDGDVVKLQIWDTAGQERFRSMTAAFYNRAQGVLLAFDVTNRDSFNNLPTWIRDVKRNGPANCVILICANKADVDISNWTVSRDEFTSFAKSHNARLFETSASTGLNVNAMFYDLSKQILVTSKSELQEMKTERESIILFEPTKPSDKRKKKPNSCC